MSRADAPAVERIIANTINETARGNPDALAARIVAALGEAGYRIVLSLLPQQVPLPVRCRSGQGL